MSNELKAIAVVFRKLYALKRTWGKTGRRREETASGLNILTSWICFKLQSGNINKT